MKIWLILFGSNYSAIQKFLVNRLKKVYNVLYVVIMIYYRFQKSILIVQFKRIIINFISIIGLQIVKCISHTLFEKGTIPHFIWIRWTNAANLIGILDQILILSKIVKSFFFLWKWSCVKAFSHLLWLTKQSSDVLFTPWGTNPKLPLTLFWNKFWWHHVKKDWCFIHITV